jgi:hypothetical protein
VKNEMKNSSILNIILATCLLLLLIKLNTQKSEHEESSGYEESIKIESDSSVVQDKNVLVSHQAWVKLTVAESKRLIAKGLVKYPPLAQKLKKGQLIIARGTSNTYVAEEILKETIVPGAFVTGRISPEKGTGLEKVETRISEIVLRNGERLDIDFVEALDASNDLDIVLKGANLLNYSQRKAAVLIGSSTGGTLGQVLLRMKNDKIRLIIPVGLEKNSSYDLQVLSEKLQFKVKNIDKKVPELWLLPGEIFTEIEAIQQFADVEVSQIGSGGIAGAEGAVSLLIRGGEAEVNKALKIIGEIQGEPAFKNKF